MMWRRVACSTSSRLSRADATIGSRTIVWGLHFFSAVERGFSMRLGWKAPSVTTATWSAHVMLDFVRAPSLALAMGIADLRRSVTSS